MFPDIMSSQSPVQETVMQQSEDMVVSLAERLDFINIQILRKFYMTGREFPHDTQPHCFAVLFMEMKTFHKVRIGSEALRKRLDKLVSMKLIEKVGRTNPANYFPVKGREQTIRAVITRFMMNNGLSGNLM